MPLVCLLRAVHAPDKTTTASLQQKMPQVRFPNCHKAKPPTSLRDTNAPPAMAATERTLFHFFFLFVHHEHRLEEESEWWVLRHSPILRSRRWPGRCQRKKGLIKPLMPSDGRKRRRLLTSRLVCRASGRTDHRSNSDARRGGVRSARCCFIVLCSLPYPQGKVKPQLFLDSPRWCLCPAFFLSLV